MMEVSRTSKYSVLMTTEYGGWYWRVVRTDDHTWFSSGYTLTRWGARYAAKRAARKHANPSRRRRRSETYEIEA